MESQALAEVTTEKAFSMVELLMTADPVVKAVLIALVIASIWSWAVVAEKLFAIGGARKKADEFEEAFWNGRADDYEMRPGQNPDNAGARLFASISREWRDAKAVTPAEHGALVARAERSLRATVDREVGKISNGIGALATIGSASPFIGLFGTVWGIMNAFLNISAQEDTSLAVVGGPIAEALFATAIGLFAAIPAVIAYNRFSHGINRLEAAMTRFADGFYSTLSR
ncbi:MAG: protein TolQ, partial [Pseudomonadota bacterium]|nr:protein TolQ [Pseudomonadota bacterium]